jgi:bacterioferritin (cytochrome b1)
MIPKPGVVDALNTLLKLEITLHECEHGWEKVWQCLGYKGLRKYYDKCTDVSRDHRRYLSKRIIRFGGTLKIESVSMDIDPATPVRDVLATSLGFARTVLEAYRMAYQTIEDAGDATTADDICDMTKEMECMVFKLEAFERQIEDIGIQEWLAEHL